jgi:hypothetical protein
MESLVYLTNVEAPSLTAYCIYMVAASGTRNTAALSGTMTQFSVSRRVPHLRSVAYCT